MSPGDPRALHRTGRGPRLTGDGRPLAVTTGRRPEPEDVRRAQAYAAQLGCPYLPREGKRLEILAVEAAQAAAAGRVPGLTAGSATPAALLVVQKERLALVADGSELVYHPGMGRPRAIRVLEGGGDYLVEAAALQPGDTVVDCTLGLAADALVMACAVGESGQVIGLESVGAVAVLVAEGLARYPDPSARVSACMRRIQVIWEDHLRYLERLADRSVDVVYFDPMFREPVHLSSGISPLRAVADYRPVGRDSVRQALRVARRRVVLKERQGSPVFVELGFTQQVGGPKRRIAYGILEV